MVKIRQMREDDYLRVKHVINDWWGGRQMEDMVPRLFFIHFTNTSFIVEEDGDMIGFLIGFLSQSRTDEAYIHFVGVHPNYRGKGVGRHLYQHFFKRVLADKDYITVSCITSPVNKNSIAFHVNMGFEIKESPIIEDGVYIQKDYDGMELDRVAFRQVIKNLRR